MIHPTGKNLVVILGQPRSGTTLLGALLESHPEVHCPPEPWLLLALEALGRTSPAHPAESRVIGQAVREFMDDDLALDTCRRAAVHVYNARARAAGKRILVDKTPRYYHILPFIDRLLPDARYVWIRRDPFDVAASYQKTWDVNVAALIQSDPGHPCSLDFLVGLPRIQEFVEASGERVHTLAYESLVDDPEGTIRAVLRHIGARGTAPVEVPDEARAALRASSLGDRKLLRAKGVHGKSVGSSREVLSTLQRQVLLDALGTERIAALGYAAEVEQQLAADLVDNGPTPVRLHRDRAEEALRARWRRIETETCLTTDPPVDPHVRINELATQLDAATVEQERLTADLERLGVELAARTAERDAAQAERESLATAQTELRGQFETFRSEAESSIGRLNADLAESRDERDALARDKESLEAKQQEEREAHAAAVKAKDEQYNQLAHDHRTLVDQYGQVQRTLQERTRQLEEVAKRSVMRQYLAASIQLADGIFSRVAHRGPRRPLPRISLVTPVYNGAEHIRATIESVLKQGYPGLEYIIVDGASTDGTMDIVDEYRDRLHAVISEPDRGMYDAIRKGFAHATGEVLGYLNADDMLEPGGLFRVGESFRRHPKANVIYREDTISASGWRFPNRAQPNVDMYHLLKGHILFQDGVYFRRGAYEAIGGIDPDLRLAGDYDLWLRLSRHFRFRRADGHVSSFRIRPGQLSTDMDAYGVEQRRAREAFRARMRLIGYARRLPRHAWNGVRNLASRAFGSRRRRFFYPMNFAGPLPPATSPPEYANGELRDPITGAAPDRLLFSSTDTRFGHPLINYVYYSSETDTAVTWPPLSRDQLKELYETYYSSGLATCIEPPPGYTSPYRGYRGGGLLGRVVRRAPIPWRVRKVMNWHERGDWGEICRRELLRSVRGLFDPKDPDVTLLDVGCFEGHLLDQMRDATAWQTCGLEPNAAAVAAARAKGHEVWEAFAEDAVLGVPEDRLFDIIYLGQTIEHFDDPVTIVRRLATMLKPGGAMVLSTPNLDSAQIDLFGPTWSHWHVPYHRVLFSKRSLRMLAERSGLRVQRSKTYSNSFWTAYSLKVNELGLGGAAPHTWMPPPPIMRRAQCVAAWSKLLWDWRGRGDYVVITCRHR